jgi:N-acetylglucosaminyldiphosphoundecaprenol N-acetyl-beta-D-mannosaminyltransferase
MHFTKLMRFIYNACMNIKEILGVRVNMGLNTQEVVDIAENMINDENSGHYICTTNPEFIMEAQKDTKFKEIINSSDLSVPDGVGIIAAGEYLDGISVLERNRMFLSKSILLGFKVGLKTLFGNYSKKRITGVLLAEKLFELSSKKKYSVFLLGGWPRDWLGRNIEVEEDFATLTGKVVEKKYPGVFIVGSASKFSFEEKDDGETILFLKNKMKEKNIEKIDILMVAYGQNNQEKWIARNADRIPAKLSIGLGGTFDYISGHNKQIPSIITVLGLEWLFRLFTQPFRIRRIINAFPIFPIEIFLSSIKHNKQ